MQHQREFDESCAERRNARIDQLIREAREEFEKEYGDGSLFHIYLAGYRLGRKRALEEVEKSDEGFVEHEFH